MEPSGWNKENITRKLIKLEILGFGRQRKSLLKVRVKTVNGATASPQQRQVILSS